MKKVLFVCTGNTCRSPMAEAIFNKIMADDENFSAFSRGLFAFGDAISQNSKAVLLENGIQSNHTSKQLDQNDMECADIVIGLTNEHTAKILSLFPQYAHKVLCLENSVQDPYGKNIDAYRECYTQIETLVKGVIDKFCTGDN